MSCSKPLPPFSFEFLCYLNRDQLERFSIVCRSLKNIIGRYFSSKPYRVFDQLEICGGSYALRHKKCNRTVQCHPNRDDFSVQQFLAGQIYTGIGISNPTYYSFAEMRPYLGPTVRIKWTLITGDFTYNAEHIEDIFGAMLILPYSRIMDIADRQLYAEHFQPILNSPTILQCRRLQMENAHFSFKDYKILYTVNLIFINYNDDEVIDLNYWVQFLELPGLKPTVMLRGVYRQCIDDMLDSLSKAFLSAVAPNAFKIVFIQLWNDEEPLIKFRETNRTSGEILELKEGLPPEYQNDYHDSHEHIHTLERSGV